MSNFYNRTGENIQTSEWRLQGDTVFHYLVSSFVVAAPLAAASAGNLSCISQGTGVDFGARVLWPLQSVLWSISGYLQELQCKRNKFIIDYVHYNLELSCIEYLNNDKVKIQLLWLSGPLIHKHTEGFTRFTIASYYNTWLTVVGFTNILIETLSWHICSRCYDPPLAV